MATKATWLFGGSTSASGLTWGFSESWYTNLAGDALINAMDLVSSRRVQILSRSSEIVGYRIGTPNGRSFVVRKRFSSPSGNDWSNMPVDAALCQCGIAGSDNRKKFFFHDLPDDWVNLASVEAARRPAINTVISTIAAAGFLVRFQNPIAVAAPILAVDALGAVTTSAPVALAVNNVVSFLNMRDTNNRAIRGTFVVDLVTDPTHFRVAHWGGSIVGRSGRVRVVSFLVGAALYLGDTTSIIRGGSRKVGRPFFQLRGRAPVRR